MKKLVYIALALCLLVGTLALSSCGGAVKIAVPNDTTNEARALMLLEAQGIIKLKAGVGIGATVLDITENPYNIKFYEAEAASLPRVLDDVDYAVINTNYAIAAGINPLTDALAMENSASAYANIIAVKAGHENDAKIKALVAAMKSSEIADYINANYGGAAISVVDDVTNGYDASIDYASLSGANIKIAASPVPHAEILEIAKRILAAKGITLEIIVFSDYIIPNQVVDEGECDANYFQHVPYLNDFNANNGTGLVSVCEIHVEPMGIYSSKHDTLIGK